MFKDIPKLIIASLLLFVIWGCGTMAKEEDKISVPQKVSIEMPKALESKEKRTKRYLRQEKQDENKSSAYLELKEDVQFLEDKRVDLELNLLLINEVIDTIDVRCKEVALEKVCIIEEDALMVKIDENLSKKIIELTHEPLAYEIGDELVFGEVELVKYAKNALYQYRLKMDTTFDDILLSSSETISWSKDEDKILSYYIEENKEYKRDISIKFEEEKSKEKKIRVEDNLIDKVEKSSDSFYLEILKHADIDETYTVSSRSVNIDSNLIKNSFASLGQLSNQNGYLNFEGLFEGETFKEKETFDGNGQLLSSSYCWSDMSCDLEDEESWFNF